MASFGAVPLKMIVFASRKIPLIPRSPTSQDLKESMKKANKAKGKNADDASSPPPDDPDERLIFDAFKNSIAYINNIVNTLFVNYYFLELNPDVFIINEKNIYI